MNEGLDNSSTMSLSSMTTDQVFSPSGIWWPINSGRNLGRAQFSCPLPPIVPFLEKSVVSEVC